MATTADDVWRLLGELTEAQKETERRFQETERLLRAQSQETERLMREQSQETERLMREQSQETDRKLQATAEENRRVIRQVSQQLGELGGKWGLFVENLVAPACETIFLARGIPVHQVSQRVRKRLEGNTLEIDVLVLNQAHVLAVEVKSTLDVDDVRTFVEILGQFRTFFPEHDHRQLYGAVAGISINPAVECYAYRQGLFVLAQSGETVVILNDEPFQPRAW